MKKRNLLFIPFILGMGIGLLSCNFGHSGNITNYPAAPAVISFNLNMGGITMGTPWGYFAAPELIDVMDGDCIYENQFTVDFDNQPSTQFFTATGISKLSVDQSYIDVSDTVDIGDYTLLLANVNAMSSVYFQGRFFVGMTSKDKSPSFRLVYNRNEPDVNGVKNLYLLAQPSQSGTSTSDVGAIYAFDLSYLLQGFGRDTTITSDYPSGIKRRYVNANLNYLTGITDTGTPIFTKAQPPPQSTFYEIHMFQ